MKAILLVRVSTEAQDFTEQEREIYQMALNDGYSKEDIIPICEKESGIKLEEEERAGLNRMKELIEEGNVDCVYCWEVSRIARRKKINFSVLEYLTRKKVQLIIKNPAITLFNRDGSINEGAEVVFTLFSQMAESEMRTKKERFKRSKDARRKQSYYTGGFILFGYTVDAEKRFIPKKDEAEFVQLIFNTYLTGKYSYRSLAKEFKELGLFASKVSEQFISSTLTNKAYAGLPSSVDNKMNLKTDGNIYPALVTVDMIEKCKEISKKNIIEPKKKYSTYYFGKNILRCPCCGKVMTANKARNFYHCTKCGSGMTVNINVVDSALWDCALPLYYNKVKNSDNTQKQHLQAQIALLIDKIDVCTANISSLRDRAEKVEYKAYVEGTMDIAKADRFIGGINDKIANEEKSIETYKNQIQSYNSMLIADTVTADMDITDDKVRYEIVHRMIKWASIDRNEENKRQYDLTVYDYTDSKTTYVLDTRRHKIYKDGVERQYEERFTNYYIESRKEYLKAYRATHKEDKEKNRERVRRYRERQKNND
jgi:DNA invertase Pin-like site-specific DNA recombinase